MPTRPTELHAADLAPGDRTFAAGFDWRGFGVERIRSSRDARFEAVYARLWEEFGDKGEMERREVIERRLAWDPARLETGCSLAYEMIAVTRGSGGLAAVRDHTAILRRAGDGQSNEVVVHLSHAWVDPAQRGTGLAAWLRAWPLQAARQVLQAAGIAEAEARITLVAEMEPRDASAPETLARLKSYARAGFLMVDPRAIDYLQPDFRATMELKEPEEVDAREEPRPLPLRLVLRRVGREGERELPASELMGVVDSLYRMYSASFGARHVDPLRQRVRCESDRIRLLPPDAPLEDFPA